MIRRTAVYTMSGMFSAMVSFLLLPVMTRYLTPYDYGVIETVIAVAACMAGILIMGGDTLLSKEYFRLSDGERSGYISNTMGVILALSTVSIVAIFLLRNRIADLIKIDGGLIMLGLAIACMNAIVAVLLSVYQLEKKARIYAFFVNSRMLLDTALSLVLIVSFGMAWKGRLSGLVVSSLVFLVLACISLRKRNVGVALKLVPTKSLVLLGFPLAMAHVSGWTNEMIGKLMINNIIGLDATGLYSVGLRFGMVMFMMETALSRAWLPFFFENININSQAARIKIIRATYACIAGMFILALMIGIGGKYVLFMMVAPEYYAASQFIFIVSMAYFFDGVWKLFLGYLTHENKTRMYSYIVFAAAVINVALSYILLIKVGIIGAAWAMLTSYATGAVLTVIAAGRYHPMPWFSKDVLIGLRTRPVIA